MALFNNFRHKRRVVNEVEWATFFEGEVWKEIKKVAFEAAEKDYVLTRPEDKDVIRPWLHQLRRNTEELEEVKKTVARLTAALQQANAGIFSHARSGTISCSRPGTLSHARSGTLSCSRPGTLSHSKNKAPLKQCAPNKKNIVEMKMKGSTNRLYYHRVQHYHINTTYTVLYVLLKMFAHHEQWAGDGLVYQPSCMHELARL